MEEIEEEVVVPETTEEEVEPEEEVVEEVDWKAEAEKQKEIAENQRIRAEKAEKKTKEKVEPTSTHSTSDIVALSKVHEDDIERVEKFAKDEGVSIKEALKNDELTAILNVRAEKRNVSDATNTGNSRRVSAKVSDEALIANASSGKLPTSDEDIDRLIAAKLKNK